MQSKITVDQWHELTDDKKEVLRKWAISHSYGLEIVNSSDAATCDYAALFTAEQMCQFLREVNAQDAVSMEDVDSLWFVVKQFLEK